jgi:2-polyprenyl-3-methyl-5-hydroxy-6-metoxy-1,4-benzoquinol methylase
MSNYSDSAFSEEAANTSWYKVFHQIPDKAKVLDVGCSSGNFGVELKKRKNCQVDGIELDSSDFKKAQKNLDKVYQLNIETDDISELAKDYDVIYFGDVVEHLVNPAKALEKVKHHLSPTGFILFSIPNMAHATIRLLLLEGDFEYTETGLLDKTHLHFYNQKEIERVFAEAGLKIEYLDYVEKDYPKALLKDYLKKLGLTANDDFFKRMAAVDASAFQFVGRARPSKSVKEQKLKTFGPVDLFETYFTNTVAGFEAQKKELQAKLEAAEAKAKQLHDELMVAHKNPIKFYGKKVARKLRR